MAEAKILVIGSANVDLVVRVPRCPRPGETILGSTFTKVPGGKGANQAVAAARLGARTFFAGCVGNDGFADLLRDSLEGAGVDLAHLRTHPTEPTGTAFIYVADEGQNSIVVAAAANAAVTADVVARLEPAFEGMDAVVLQLEIPLDGVEAALDLAAKHDVLSVLDIGVAGRVPEQLLRKAGIVSPNESEAEAMTGLPVQSLADAERAAEKLRSMGAREVVMKLGANGALYAGEEVLHAPPFKVTPVDTVAAGDAFTAALAVAWNRVPRLDALRFANATGALATTVAGAQPSMPARGAVEALMKEQQP